MKPLDLINSANFLANASRGRPNQVYLRRATSAAYYALFHCLAQNCANLLVGNTKAFISEAAWRQVYRGLDHGTAKRACRQQTVSRFPAEVINFASQFAIMQEKRHEADYDPHVRLTKSEVLADIEMTAEAIRVFQNASTKDRRAFAVFVLLKSRT